MKQRCLIGSAFIIVSLAGVASAGPSSADVDDMFSIFGFEARGFVAASPTFDQPVAGGGDAHVMIESSQVAVLAGGRIGSDGSGTQFGGFDFGVRVFPQPANALGAYLQGGLLIGGTATDDFAFATGSLVAASAEAGIEWPRTSRGRFVSSVRLDLGVVSPSADAQVKPDPHFAMASLNMGFLIGGHDTKAAIPVSSRPASLPEPPGV
jgi:hypothetical protein